MDFIRIIQDIHLLLNKLFKILILKMLNHLQLFQFLYNHFMLLYNLQYNNHRKIHLQLLVQYINDIHKLLLMQHLKYVHQNAKILLFHVDHQMKVILINNHLLMVLLNPILKNQVQYLIIHFNYFMCLHDLHQSHLIIYILKNILP